MLIPFFSLYCVDAATVHGTIYDSDIEVVNGVIVTINTLPEQTSVASQGDYSFEVNVGDYFIEFEYFEENQLVYSQIEEISIIEEGNYLIDIILLPNLNDDITEDNLDVINPYNGSSTYWIVYIILLLIVSYFVWRKIKNPPLKKTSLEEDDIKKVQDEYVNAAKNAIAAGFDGIELHGANGYLIDQFINPGANKRTDNYGGSPENRNRFAIEVARKVAEAIGPEHTAIRLSPYGVFNDMEIFDGIEDAFEHLAIELNKLKLLYIHLVDHASMGAPEVPDSIKQKIRNAFKGILIMSGGMNKNKAQQLIDEKKGDLMAFARGFLANPDLVLRLDQNLPLNEPDHSTFYTPGEKGYTDYPVHK